MPRSGSGGMPEAPTCHPRSCLISAPPAARSPRRVWGGGAARPAAQELCTSGSPEGFMGSQLNGPVELRGGRARVNTTGSELPFSPCLLPQDPGP